MKKEIKNCHCGKPLHYTDPELRKDMDETVELLGEFIPVHVSGRTWSVSRHYIALHGVKATDLPTLGFKEIV